MIELQTNFGGGKTHSMIALFHLFSGGDNAASLTGIDHVMQAAGVEAVPVVKRAVLVAQALSPGIARKKKNGTEVRTMWGELAHHLGGREGFQMVADADRHGVSPGSDVLRLMAAVIHNLWERQDGACSSCPRASPWMLRACRRI